MNWFPLGITYAAFYMGRYNLNVASTEFMTRFSLTKSQFGIIATAGFWTYAMSVIFNGPLTDRIGGRKAILMAAAGSALINATVGLLFLNGWTTKVLVGMSLLYSVNQYFQSFGALSVVKCNAPWFHVRERGVFGGIFGMMISSGYFLAMTIGGWILAYLPWYCVFLIPSAAMATMFLIDNAMVADNPAAAGFSNFNTGDATSHQADKDKPVDLGYLVKNVFTNPVIMTFVVAEFCTGFVRQGLLLWFVPFLKEVHHIKPGTTLFTVATTGITVAHIPYKGGAPALSELLGGQVATLFDQLSSSIGYIKDGRLRALAVTSAKRSALLPAVPTLDESGLKGYEASTYIGVLGPAGLPKPVLAKLNGAMVKVMEMPAVAESLPRPGRRAGIELAGSVPEAHQGRAGGGP